MDRPIKAITIVTLVGGAQTLLVLIISSFSAPWIVGDLASTYDFNVTGSTIRESNTSGSCSEGVFLRCCHTYNYTTVTVPTGGATYNLSDVSCSFRNRSDFHGSSRSAYTTCRLFTIFAMLLTVAELVTCALSLCVSKLQGRTVVPIVQMALLYSAAFFFMVTLILMGTKYKELTALLEPKTGWSLYAGIVAEVFIVATALSSTVTFVLMKRFTSAPYGHF